MPLKDGTLQFGLYKEENTEKCKSIFIRKEEEK